MEISLEDGKYTVVLDDEGRLYANRYDEHFWRDLSGDKLVMALVHKIEELENAVKSAKEVN